MTNTDQNSSTISRLADYLQQLIVLDMLAQAIEAQQKGGDCLPLLKALSDFAESKALSAKKPSGV